MKQLTNKQVSIITNRICNELHSANSYKLENFKKKILPGLMKNVTNTKEYKNTLAQISGAYLAGVTISHTFVSAILNKKIVGKEINVGIYDYFNLTIGAGKTLPGGFKERVEQLVIKYCFDQININPGKIEEEIIMSMLDADSVDKLIETVTAKFLSDN